MSKLKVLLGREKSLLYDEEVDNCIEEGSELEPEAWTQFDIVDNATFNYISEIVSTSENDKELEWDADLIAHVRDSTLAILERRGYRIWYPYYSED